MPGKNYLKCKPNSVAGFEYKYSFPSLLKEVAKDGWRYANYAGHMADGPGGYEPVIFVKRKVDDAIRNNRQGK